MSKPSALRLHRTTVNGPQITGGDEMTDFGRHVAMHLSACLSVAPLAEWVDEFREHAAEHPAEADAIVAAFAEYLHRDPKETP